MPGSGACLTFCGRVQVVCIMESSVQALEDSLCTGHVVSPSASDRLTDSNREGLECGLRPARYNPSAKSHHTVSHLCTYL